MIKREIKKECLALSTTYPAVSVVEPRQSGKTTLVKKVFPEYAYCNLEHPEIKELVVSDINAFFQIYKPPVLFMKYKTNPNCSL